MKNVYIEPQPLANLESAPISFYTIHRRNGKNVSLRRYRTQLEAIDVAMELGFAPLVARVRIPNKHNPNDWQPADRATLDGQLMLHNGLQRKNSPSHVAS